MVGLTKSFLALSLVATSCLAAPQVPHAEHAVLRKRLFGLNLFGDATTTTTTSSSSSTTSAKATSTSTSSAAVTTSSSVKVSSTSSTSSTTSSAALATGTNTPYGNTLVFSGQTAIVGTSDKLATYTLTSYSPQSCETLCLANALCSFYDVYYASTILSFITGSTPYCALYDNQHSVADATDTGSSMGVTYSSSNGYVMYGDNTASSVTVNIGNTITSTSKVSSSSAATSTSAVVTSSSKATTVSSTSSVAAGLINNIVAAVTSSVAAAVTTSLAVPTTSLPVTVKTSSIALPTTSVAVSTSIALPSTSISLSTSIIIPPSTTIAVSVKTTSLAATSLVVPTTSLIPTTTLASVTVSTSAACALPTWAYSGWCKTLPSMVPNMLTNAANAASLNKGYIIPLYIYPSWWSTPGAWDWIYTAAANYPSVTFTVIINPASGPGTAAVPNTDYQHELLRMSAISNIYLLGYVDTAFGSRSASAVASDISIYAGWATANAAYAMDGIFFDNQASTTSYLSLYQSYASQVRANSGFTGGIVGMSPGQVCDPSFIDIADFTVVFEDVSSVLQSDVFGWYASFLGGLSTSQLSKIVWMLSSADSTTSLAVSNVQAAMNPKYLYLTDNTGQWGAQFQSAPSSAFLTKALGLINSPLSQISTLVAT